MEKKPDKPTSKELGKDADVGEQKTQGSYAQAFQIAHADDHNLSDPALIVRLPDETPEQYKSRKDHIANNRFTLAGQLQPGDLRTGEQTSDAGNRSDASNDGAAASSQTIRETPTFAELRGRVATDAGTHLAVHQVFVERGDTLWGIAREYLGPHASNGLADGSVPCC